MISRAVSSTIAARYAQAFLRVYGESLDIQSVNALEQCAYGLSQHKKINAAFVRMLDIQAINRMQDLLVRIIAEYNLPSSCETLLQLLKDDGRLFLIDMVLAQVARYYKKQHNIATCVVRSSHALGEQAKKDLHAFLVRKTEKKIMVSSYVVDPHLIAGIRVEGETFLWEDSLDRRLREARLPFIR